MSKRFSFLVLVAFVFYMASCQREQDWDGAPDIMAKVELEQKTRTSLSVNESGSGTIYWSPSDKIDVFFGSTKASYTSQNATDAISAVFKTNDFVSGADVTSSNIWGLYPSNSSSTCDGNAITTTLPALQYGVPNTFDKDIFPAVARSSSTNLQFYNVCGGIKFNLAFDDIKKITFRGNNNEDVAGDVSISFVGGVPKATVVNGTREITLTPKAGATFVKGADYYIILLPGTFSGGFTMSFTTTDGSVAFFNYSEGEVTIRRSIFSRKSNLDVYASFGDERQPNNVIYYTSSSGQVVTPYNSSSFGANIVSNEYVGGRGIITFDGEVTSIGNSTFTRCSGLTSLEIPNSVTSIGDYAFRDCNGLTSLEIPNSVTRIGTGAFLHCSDLTQIEIPNSVTRIGTGAFEDCIGLTSLEIPNSVTSIGNHAFFGCRELTQIEIPNSVTNIGENPFGACDGLSSIIVDNGNSVYDSRNGCNAIIKTTTNELVSGCQNTIIPNSVTSIGNYAFYGCDGLSPLEIPNSVTSIGDYAFEGCSALTSLEIPNSVTSIGDWAFHSCTGLTLIKVNALSPPTLGVGVFSNTNNCPIYVPVKSVDAYKTPYMWREYADRIQAMVPSFMENLEDGYFTYDGVKYNVVKMKDGKWWMAQNLAYLPEGYTPATDLTAVTAGVFAPIQVNADQTAAEFTTDPAVVAKNGYLYQVEVALGLKVGDLTSVADARKLEAAQGICPKGWHVPTLDDIKGLVGKCTGEQTNAAAPYYNGADGLIKLLNEDGFNMEAVGAISIQDNTKTSGTFMGFMATYKDHLSSGMFCGSTYAAVTYNTSGDAASGVKNLQFYGFMPMTNKASEDQYTCNGIKVSYRIACPVRCVRDSK